MKDLVELLKQIHDEADHILGTDVRSAQVIEKDCKSIKHLAKEALKLATPKAKAKNWKTCKCGAQLWKPEAVTRTYISKSTENPDSHARGHYDESGDYIPDRSPDYPLVSHDLVDGSDTCTACNNVVG